MILLRLVSTQNIKFPKHETNYLIIKPSSIFCPFPSTSKQLPLPCYSKIQLTCYLIISPGLLFTLFMAEFNKLVSD